MLCGCVCIEKAVDFYGFPGLYTRLVHIVVPGPDSRPRYVAGLCTLESTGDNSDTPRKYSAGAVRGPQAKYQETSIDLGGVGTEVVELVLRH